ncbi:hypothetical protein ACQP2F_12380 [Actinoplanes sp. CA-030573]|uniref:hypothetical protein n=1 Tax=Actinoplanes sp. CA-030573 TaxID=3239898 RepID=UPI003D932CAF
MAGPTVDNYFPDSSGCHVFWIKSPEPGVTVDTRTFVPGETPPPDGTDAKAHPMRVEYVGCHVDYPGPGYPPAGTGCENGSVISEKQGCGVRVALTGPTRVGDYTGTLKFELSLLCAGAEIAPCDRVTSPPPSAEHPITAHWPVTCSIKLHTDNGYYADSHVVCDLAGQ